VAEKYWSIMSQLCKSERRNEVKIETIDKREWCDRVIRPEWSGYLRGEPVQVSGMLNWAVGG
jgi:hypothetical protein